MTTTGGERRASGVLWAILGLLLLGLVGILAYRLWPILYPSSIEIAAPNGDCDLRSATCEAVFASGGRVRFDVQPRGIPPATALQLGVETVGLDVQGVEVDFAGVDMYMGFNRATLEQRERGRYSGTGMIPVCVRTRMLWEARVLIHTPDGILAAPFRFEVGR